jgi:hypothetical protein
VSDKAPAALEAGFLPDLLHDQIAAQPNWISRTALYDFSKPTSSQPSNPIYFIVGFFLIYLFVSKWNARWSVLSAKFFDIVLLFLFGLGGLLVLYMSLFSLHTACHENYNLIWLHPFYWVALLCYFVRPVWAGYLGRLFLIASALLLLTSYWLPQSFSVSVYLLLLLSLFLHYRLIKRGTDAKFN